MSLELLPSIHCYENQRIRATSSPITNTLQGFWVTFMRLSIKWQRKFISYSINNSQQYLIELPWRRQEIEIHVPVQQKGFSANAASRPKILHWWFRVTDIHTSAVISSNDTHSYLNGKNFITYSVLTVTLQYHVPICWYTELIFSCHTAQKLNTVDNTI